MTFRGQLPAALSIRDSPDFHRKETTGGTRAHGVFKPVVGVGEVIFSLRFPFVFTERPLFTFGAELEENEKLVPGNYPTVSAVVHRWQARPASDPSLDENFRLYTGARVAVVTTGHPRQRMIVHLRFEALSIVYPFAPTEGVGDPL